MELAWSFCFLIRLLLFQLPALLCCEAMASAVSFLAFPLRMLTAVERERKLGRLVAEMQAQMEDLAWDNAALQDSLRAALREQQALEALLDDMEEEHDDALTSINGLEAQLTSMRLENARLNEHKGKSDWDKPAAVVPVAAEVAVKRADDPASVLALTTEAASPVSSSDGTSAALATAVARRRSLFSLGMSLTVGAVAWSADAPCLPLLAGLFAVVAVSMRSASRLRRAGGDAGALLGLNWFLLGLLTSPMLPAVAHAVAPRALGPALTSLAAAAPL